MPLAVPMTPIISSQREPKRSTQRPLAHENRIGITLNEAASMPIATGCAPSLIA